MTEARPPELCKVIWDPRKNKLSRYSCVGQPRAAVPPSRECTLRIDQLSATGRPIGPFATALLLTGASTMIVRARERRSERPLCI